MDLMVEKCTDSNLKEIETYLLDDLNISLSSFLQDVGKTVCNIHQIVQTIKVVIVKNRENCKTYMYQGISRNIFCVRAIMVLLKTLLSFESIKLSHQILYKGKNSECSS